MGDPFWIAADAALPSMQPGPAASCSKTKGPHEAALCHLP